MLAIKVVGGKQVVCDCRGDTPDAWMDRLLVSISETKDEVTISVHCPECDSSMICKVKAKLILKPHVHHVAFPCCFSLVRSKLILESHPDF